MMINPCGSYVKETRHGCATVLGGTETSVYRGLGLRGRAGGYALRFDSVEQLLLYMVYSDVIHLTPASN